MADRRTFLAGLFASSISPSVTWADAGNPAFLTAGLKPDGQYVLCGLTRNGSRVFEIPLPARGHAAAIHPIRPHAVAFARRPGRFAIVLDCAQGAEIKRLSAPQGRHFYGHGVYSADGTTLFTTENDFENARGIIGLWDAVGGYRRLGEFSSGGIGPHDVKLSPDGNSLVIANGGIETHPETGRTKLNIATMAPNLTFAALDGQLKSQMTLDPALHKNSIRHLAVSADGAVAFGMQWQGDTTDDVPSLGIVDPDHNVTLLGESLLLGGYVGSIAINDTTKTIAATSPRRGNALEISTATGKVLRQVHNVDICGVAASNAGFFYTTGHGLAGDTQHPVRWDNHLICIK